MAGELKAFVSSAGFARCSVAVAVASPEVVVKTLQFPPMPKKELESAIRMEAEQAILNGHTIDEMAFDWQVWPALDESGPIKGLLAVVPKSLMDERIRLARAAGLRPSIVDVEGLALWNAYWMLCGDETSPGKSVLLVNIGAGTTNVVVAKTPRELVLTRDIQLGAKAIEGDRQQEWVGEVRDSIVYARAAGSLRQLDEVRLTGGGVSPRAQTLIEVMTGAPVTIWNPLEKLNGGAAKDQDTADAAAGAQFAVALGLALRRRR